MEQYREFGLLVGRQVDENRINNNQSNSHGGGDFYASFGALFRVHNERGFCRFTNSSGIKGLEQSSNKSRSGY